MMGEDTIMLMETYYNEGKTENTNPGGQVSSVLKNDNIGYTEN